MAEYTNYLATLNADPEDAKALAALQQLDATVLASSEAASELEQARKKLRTTGAAETALHLFDVELASAPDTRKADLLLGKGQLLFDDLLREDASLACIDEALELEPDHERAKEMREHQVLVRANWERIVEKFLAEAAATSEPSLATTLYRAAAETTARHQPGAAEVEEYLTRALEVDPSNQQAANQLGRLLRAAQRWEDLREHLGRRAQVSSTPQVRRHAWLEIAKLWLGPFAEDPSAEDEAALAMEHVVEDLPWHSGALEFLEKHYEGKEQWESLAKLYASALNAGRRAGVLDDETGLLRKLGMLEWKKRKDLDAARECFSRLRKQDPAGTEQLDFYCDYYIKRGESAKLLQMYRQAIKHVGAKDKERKRQLMVDLARLSETHIGNPEKAIDSWKTILRAEPGNEEARASLRRLYESTGKWNALLDLIKDDVERLDKEDIAGRSALLLEVVEIYRDHLKLDVMVINTYKAILAMDPTNSSVLTELAAKYRALGRWNDLIGVLDRQASSEALELEQRCALYEQISSLWIERFGNYAQAIKPLEQLLTIDPLHAKAIAQLKEIYTRRRQWRALIALLGREAPSLPVEEQHAHFCEMARLASDKLGDVKLAIEVWNRLLALADTTGSLEDVDKACAALSVLYEREKRNTALAEILRRRRVLAETPQAALPILERLGAVFAERLRAPRQAAEVYREMLDIKPNHAKALRVLRELYAATGDFDALESLYGSLGQWNELVELFLALADKIVDRVERIQLLERAAQVAKERLGAPDKVARVFERLQGVKPDHLGAARELAQVYRELGKWQKLLTTYEVLLAHAEASDKLPLLDDMRDLCEGKLGQKEQAFNWCAEAYRLKPEDLELTADLERLASVANVWGKLSNLFEERLASNEVPIKEQLRLLGTLSGIARERLQDNQAASTYLERILALEPDDSEAQKGLEQIAVEEEDWQRLLALLKRRGEHSEELGQTVTRLFRMAELSKQRLGDPEGAIGFLEQIRQLQPENIQALEELERLYEAQGELRRVAELLEERLNVAEEPQEQGALMLRLGDLYYQRLEQPDLALSSYKEALKLAPCEGAIESLSLFLSSEHDAAVRAEVASLLLPYFESASDAKRTAMALEVLLLSCDEPTRIHNEARLAHLYDSELREPEKAYEVSLRLLYLEPDHPGNRERLMNLAERLDHQRDYRDALRDVFDLCEKQGGTGARLLLAREVAFLSDSVLDDAKGARSAWAEVIRLEPSNEEAYAALRRLLRGQEDWESLLDLLVAHSQHELTAPDRLDTLWSIVEVASQKVHDDEAMEEALERLTYEEPRQQRAVDMLLGHYEEQSRWQAMDELLASSSSQLTGEALDECVSRRARLHLGELEDVAGAIVLAADVLSRSPANSEMRDLCENLLSRSDVRLRAAQVLEPLYEAEGEFQKLCDVLYAQTEFASDSEDTSELLCRIARVQEGPLGDRDAARTTWFRALRENPRDEDVLMSAHKIAAATVAWDSYLDAVRLALQKVDDSDLVTRARLLHEGAKVAYRESGDTDRAMRDYEALLALDAHDAYVRDEAVQALDELYWASNQYEKLADLLNNSAEWTTSPAQRKARLARVAAIQEEYLKDPDAAIATWSVVLGEDPDANDALLALDRLYTSHERHHDLVDVLRRRAELATEDLVRGDHLLRLARLYQEKLADTEEAIACLHEVLELDVDKLPVLEGLTSLYRGAQRYDDVFDALNERIARSEGTARTELLFETSKVLFEHLSRKREALEKAREVLREQPDHAGALSLVNECLDDESLRDTAAQILVPLYEEAQNYSGLCELLLRVSQENLDVQTVVANLRRVAALREQKLHDMDGAWDVLHQCVKRALAEPELPDILADLQRISASQGTLERLVSVYRTVAPEVLDADLQRRLYLDTADLCRAVLHDDQAAQGYYQLVYEAEPSDPRALQALEALYREHREYESLHELLVHKAELPGISLDERVACLSEAGSLCADHLARPSDAATYWEQVLELTPASAEVSQRLQDVLSVSERWHDLSAELERRLGYAQSTQEAVSLRFRLGELCEERLDDRNSALDNYAAALDGDPTHQPALAGMERLLDDRDVSERAAALLEPVYISQQNWSQLVRIFEIKLDASNEPEERLAITRAIAELHEDQLEDLDGAFRWLGRVFVEAPFERNTRLQLERLASVLPAWERLAALYQEYLDNELSNETEVCVIAMGLADIYEQKLNLVELALRAYKRVLRAIPDDETVFGRVEGMLIRAELWEELVGLYEEVVQSAYTDVRRQDLYARLAGVQEQKLCDNAKAIDALRSLLDVNPRNTRAVEELERLLQTEERWQELADLVHAQMDALESEPDSDREVSALRLRLGQIREQHLGDIDGALEQYELLVDTPEREAALAALERLVVSLDHRERIAQILEPVYRENDWWQKLVVILDAQLAYAEDPVRRGNLLREIAKLHETRGGDLGLAFEALSKAWLEEPGDASVYSRMIELAATLHAHDALIKNLEESLLESSGVLFDPELASRILLELAMLYETTQSDSEAAIRTLRRLLKVVDDHPTALAELDRLLLTAENWQDLVPIVARRAECADEESTLGLYKRLARLQETRCDNRTSAIASYQEVLRLDPRDDEAVEALVRLYTAEEKWSELLEILLVKRDLQADPTELRALNLRLAELSETKLEDRFLAVDYLRAILDAYPQDSHVLGELRRLYCSQQMWPDALEIMDRHAEFSTGEDKVQKMYDAALLVEEHLADVSEALERYGKVVAIEPAYAPAIEALERFTGEEETRERACEVLEALYRSQGNYDALARLFECRLEAAVGDVAGRVVLFQALADIREVLQQDLTAAFSVWTRALEDAPEDESALANLERLAASLGTWRELVKILEKASKNTTDPEVELRYALKLGALYEESLDELEIAAERYQQALAVTSDETVPLTALSRIYERSEKFRELADVLARQADVCLDPLEQVAYLFRLGEVLEHTLGDIEGALRAYADVLERDPGHTATRGALQQRLAAHEEYRGEVIAILEPLYEADANPTALVELYASKLTIVEDSFERAQLYERIAGLVERELQDDTRALDAMGGWLAEDPDSQDALEGLLRLGKKLDRQGEIVARLDGIVEASDSIEVQEHLGLKSAQMKLYELNDLDSARAGFDTLRQRRPDDLDVLSGLEEVHRRTGDNGALIEVLWHRGEVSYEPTAKRRDFAEVARLHRELGDLGSAISAWNAVLEMDESDREARSQLAELYRMGERWRDLVDLLGKAVEHTVDSTELTALHMEMAGLYTNELGEADAAIEEWKSVLDLEPGNLQALDALEHLYRQSEDFLAVQDVLSRRVEVVEAHERVDVLLRLATLAQTERNEPDDAVEYLRSALEVDIAHPAANERLGQLLRKLERWHDLVELCQVRAEFFARAGDTSGELYWLGEAADIWEGPLDNPDAAGEILEAILNRDPTSVAALTRLGKIYEGAGDWERCEDILQRALALGPQGRDAADLHVRLGEVARLKDGDDEKALLLYQRALEFDGYHPIAIERVEESARQAEDWPVVADLVRRRFESTQDLDDKTHLAVELAELYGNRLAQPQNVVGLLESIADVRPDEPRVIAPLADLYVQVGRYDDAVPMLESLAETAKKARRMKEVASYKQRLAGILAKRGDAAQAAVAYEEAFRIDPTNVSTMLGLGALYMDAQDWDKARRVYRSMVLQSLDPSLGVTKADVYYKLGWIHEALEESAKAKDMYRRALSADREHVDAQVAMNRLGG